MKKIKIDVGANNGKDTLELATEDSIVYAFEPTQELLIQHLWPISNKCDNIKIIPFAVDIKNSFQTFNVAGQWDWGCSSLYEFSDDIETKWPNRPDFKKTHSYTVPTITLYDFCNLYGIDKIDFLHIDAQGSDYNVLLSLKDKISIVKEGTIEVADKVELYSNTNNRIEDVRSFLTSNGFKIVSETPNDVIGAEINIKFIKND
jgi:FkbM family methyltransferase